MCTPRRSNSLSSLGEYFLPSLGMGGGGMAFSFRGMVIGCCELGCCEGRDGSREELLDDEVETRRKRESVRRGIAELDLKRSMVGKRG